MGRSVGQVVFRGTRSTSACGLSPLCSSQDRYAYGTSQPVVDNTTADWFGIQGREQSGWTAIQFRRLLDTCDTMDVPIRVRTPAYSFRI